MTRARRPLVPLFGLAQPPFSLDGERRTRPAGYRPIDRGRLGRGFEPHRSIGGWGSADALAATQTPPSSPPLSVPSALRQPPHSQAGVMLRPYPLLLSIHWRAGRGGGGIQGSGRQHRSAWIDGWTRADRWVGSIDRSTGPQAPPRSPTTTHLRSPQHTQRTYPIQVGLLVNPKEPPTMVRGRFGWMVHPCRRWAWPLGFGFGLGCGSGRHARRRRRR